jgi:Tfp pilus assembly protein PilF
LFELAEGKLKLGLKKEAMELYSKVVQKDPSFKKAWSRLAQLYKEESADATKQVQELDAQNKIAR